jgi:hypothetical protein
MTHQFNLLQRRIHNGKTYRHALMVLFHAYSFGTIALPYSRFLKVLKLPPITHERNAFRNWIRLYSSTCLINALTGQVKS